jgi:predicted HNH restriction endonuclease
MNYARNIWAGDKMAVRITEAELLLPSLYLMNLNGGQITTSDLIKKLRHIMNPAGEDLQILAGRIDDKFSQKVRNLRAHSTFERFNYAQYKGEPRNGYVEITDTGRRHLERNSSVLKYLLINDFSYADLAESLRRLEDNQDREKLEAFDENITIQEGYKELAETAIYERSSCLRNYAIKYYKKDDRISCHCCSFNFSDFYGKELGDSFIEIHYTKPILKYEDDDIESILSTAMGSVIPVCSNCHRMIHRTRFKPLKIQSLVNSINENGVFTRSS